ncbi:MAG: hypothetical protein CFH31_00663, partial [Alphaproteobacteria bacterium MarineAlpha9_Bin1]
MQYNLRILQTILILSFCNFFSGCLNVNNSGTLDEYFFGEYMDENCSITAVSTGTEFGFENWSMVNIPEYPQTAYLYEDRFFIFSGHFGSGYSSFSPTSGGTDFNIYLYHNETLIRSYGHSDDYIMAGWPLWYIEFSGPNFPQIIL